MVLKIKHLYTYPVKSLRATEMTEVPVTINGMPYDRKYMILKVIKNDDGSAGLKNMAVAHFSEMTLFFTAINMPDDGDALKATITITYKPPTGTSKSLHIPLKPDTAGLTEFEVIMHLSSTPAYRMDQKYNDWLSSCFGYEVVLAYLGDNTRKVLMSTHGNRQPSRTSNFLTSMTNSAAELVFGRGAGEKRITFADCAPYLVVSEKSMEDVNARLPAGEQMDITKFRPNIILSGADEVWEEDYWAELTIDGDVRIDCEQNCARCKSINIDYATGQSGTGEAGQMLKKLSSNRRVDPGMKWSPIFGRYSFLNPANEGHVIKVGDAVVVSKHNEERTRFDWEGLCTK